MMLEIGSLVGISKAFLETFVVLKKIIGDSKGGDPEKICSPKCETKLMSFKRALKALQSN